MFSPKVLTTLAASEEAALFLRDELQEAIEYNKNVLSEYKKDNDAIDQQVIEGYELEQQMFKSKLDALADEESVKDIFESTFLQNFKEVFKEGSTRYEALVELYDKDSLVDRIAFDSILADMISLVKTRTIQMVDQAFDEIGNLDKESLN